MDEDALRAMLPMGFGRQAGRPVRGKPSARKEPEPAHEPAPEPGPAPAEPAEPPAGNDEDLASDDDTPGPQPYGPDAAPEDGQEEEAAREADVPLSHRTAGPGTTAEFGGAPLEKHAEMNDHTKTVSALALDPSGARVATGSHDYDVKLWDFGGMTSSMRPFRTFEPAENYPVVQLAFSLSGDRLLCLNATTQPRMYSRDGDELGTYRKGDVYMRDMRHTTGHVSDITSGAWHPTDAKQFMTAGTDSTVRLWDVEYRASQKTVVNVRSKERGARTKVTAAQFSPDGRTLLAAGLDGALYAWSTSGSFSRPVAIVDRAHESGTVTSSIAVAADGRRLATRGGDDSVKLWDLRALRKPLAERAGVPNGSDHTDVVFSPDDRTLLTGVAAVPRDSGLGSSPDDPHALESKWGQLALLDAQDLAVRHVHPVGQSSVVRTAWHPRLNQVLASTRHGVVHVFYDPQASKLGALLAVGKRARMPAPSALGVEELPGGGTADVPILTPDAPSQPNKRRNMDRIRRDPRASQMPERPVTGKGYGGRIGAAATQRLVQNIFPSEMREEDPREALLKYADKAEQDPRWTSVYAKTQPKPIYDERKDEEQR